MPTQLLLPSKIEPTPPPIRPSGRPGRHIRLPARYRDEPPDPPRAIPRPIPDPDPEPEPLPSASIDAPRKWIKTEPNAHGLYKVFPNQPSHDPEDSISLDDLCRSSELLTEKTTSPPESGRAPWFPFLSATVARLMSWFHLGSNVKSVADLDSLVHDVLLHPDFDQKDLKGFSAARENQRLDDAAEQSLPGEPPKGWKTGSVKIKLPAHKSSVPEADAPEFEVTGIIYRPLLDVMKEAFQSPAFLQFHTTPFEYRWDPNHNPDNPDSTLDDADAPVDEQGLPPASSRPSGCTVPYLETIIAAFMFWSDSTHLANFGNASLWPLYTFFGNLSKYIRAKPTANAGYHQAYFPSLPDSIKDFYRNLYKVAPSADVLAHLKRELIHAVWDMLLTPEFIHAYIHGIVVKCYDGIERLIFPRFFTVLLATIKNFGGCPCPRCFIEKEKISDMGTKADMRRRLNTRKDTSSWRETIQRVRTWIFDKGYLITGAAVNRLLKPQSWVPTMNAFSKLALHGFNLFSMFVPDLLHEVELGVVKSLFIHTLRILQAHSSDALAVVDERFRKIPTFGRCTIRRFHANVSEMKKLAARDFEDILQCILPVIDGILPDPHNDVLLDLWYILATWHAYAKLRMHTTSSVGIFSTVTTVLGAKVREFIRTVCEAYTTYELPKEATQRARRQAQQNAANAGRSSETTAASTRKRKTWNIQTYKYHSLGDYPLAILEKGTTDSYSTQTAELTHRVVKRFYARTNKRQFGRQIAKHEHRQRLLRSIKQKMKDAATSAASATDSSPTAAGDATGVTTTASTAGPTVTAPATPASTTADRPIGSAAARKLRPADEHLPRTPPGLHHHISLSKRSFFNIYEFSSLSEFADDPAVKDFLKKLRTHLLCRLLDLPYDGDEEEFSPQDLMDVVFQNDRLYTHQIMRINYTTYDVQRAEDSINPRTNSDVMVLSREDEDGPNSHPYWYARVLGIFHADVRHVGPRSRSSRSVRMEFLWVRWFGRDLNHKSGWKAKRLDRLGFIPAIGESADDGAFGFLDPDLVIRAAHIIPAFRYGKTSDLLPKSIARRPEDEDEDYVFYYVNCFVDRDMFMRYFGTAPGHRIVQSTSIGAAEGGSSDADDEMDVDDDSPTHRASVDDVIPGPDVADPDEEPEHSDSDKSDLEDDEDAEGEDEDEAGLGENDEEISDLAGYDEL
ncbi:GLOBIN domain-containing protein [Mycena sanguinolenta]|uniref:GLOBIN domain-containing protein n=1 Tax=Mycena sanguinolenta TaxID=230812 RepID=A0A8H6ZB77_9AGAR|nr:GLOBIN domain-containing protein [Mycena sanguinolenta]